MTIVISDLTYMASDSLVDDNGLVHETQKIFTSPRAIIGIAGDLDAALKFVYWFNDRRRKRPRSDEFDALLWTKKHGLMHYSGKDEPVQLINPWAIGTGADVGMGALYAAERLDDMADICIEPTRIAVEVACNHVSTCGGKTQLVELAPENLVWNFTIPK